MGFAPIRRLAGLREVERVESDETRRVGKNRVDVLLDLHIQLGAVDAGGGHRDAAIEFRLVAVELGGCFRGLDGVGAVVR